MRRFAFCLALALASAFAPGARAEAPIRLRVLTWNVWGLPAVSTNLVARMAALPDAIASQGVDLVLLQEIWAESDGARVKAGLERHGYRYVSHLAHTEHGMTGLFTASKLPLEQLAFVPFASGRIGHSLWHLEWIASKGVGRFLLRTSLGELEVQNTHLQAQYDTDGYDAERLSQASQILLMQKERTRALVLGGDFNTGAEELPRKMLLDLCTLTDATPSPRPDTIFVRSGGNVAIRVLETRQALTEPIRLDNGVTAELSDHPAVVVDLELSPCSGCAPAVVPDRSGRRAAQSALTAAAAITPGRVTLSLTVALTLLALTLAILRRTRTKAGRSRGFRVFRLAGLTVLATGFVWTLYLGGLYYPARAKALRQVAGELEALP